MDQIKTLIIEPIGFITSDYQMRYDAPRQPHVEEAIHGKIELKPHMNFEMALTDLKGFSHIWLIYQFHKNKGWKPKVLPPRATREKKGLFATRSPYRPNPIGMSVVKLVEIKGRTLYVDDHDLLDGTPILDIKPYLTYCDSHPEATSGWINELDEKEYTIVYKGNTEEKLNWLESHGIGFQTELERRLGYDPFPHPYRRIKKRSDGGLIMFYKEWGADYHIDGLNVFVTRVFSGFTEEKILLQPEQSIHKLFIGKF